MAASSNLNQFDELSLLTLPLTGRSLIEASAGTGKTYSLAFIYLRLLLGVGQNSYHHPLSVEEILVVTFTQAATEELRHRIRKNINQLRKACIVGLDSDQDFQNLMDLIDDKEQALKQLSLAEQNMDEAAIFTIHGFCQRILTTYAFESGVLFKQALIKNESALYLQAVNDFWRHYFTPIQEDIAKIIWQNWADPNALLNDIYPYLYQLQPDNIEVSSGSLSEKIQLFHQNTIAKIDAIKKSWLFNAQEIENLISQSDINKRSYSKNNLPRWINAISQWAKSPTRDYQIPSELDKFTQAALNNKTQIDKKPPKHTLFHEIEVFLADQFDLRNVILFDIVAIVSQTIKNEKSATAKIGFNDLLDHLHIALKSDQRQFLVQQISQQYPVAMIDEFQDTDPIQYQIFDTIYQDRKNRGLLLIGDPKQAIYGFRGADIFTYIKAKASVDHQFSMSTNWRSSAKMVESINDLFRRRHAPFIFDEIPFIEMNSAAKNQHKTFHVNQQEIAPLSCYLLPESITSNSDYLDHSAQYCAERIANWLSGTSYFCDDGVTKMPLKSSDIAILVRTGREADIIQQKLNQRNIKSVYLSNHKSVFESLEARELLRILNAVLIPTNENNLRSALATQIIGASMADIDKLSNDSNQLELIIEEFKQYQSIWLNYGVLVMLRRVMHSHQRIENLLSFPQGERIVTNLMHLSELLQEAAQDVDTPNALLRWLTKQINDPDSQLDNHEQRLENDENLIHIITLHKSKGLEFPIVFLPFIATYRTSDRLTYHDRRTHKIHYANELSQEIKQLIEEERLAEDLRLLYVGLTRAIYHCSFGIAGLKKTRSNLLSLGHSAIGSLLLDEDQKTYASIQSNIEAMTNIELSMVELPITLSNILSNQTDLTHSLEANVFHRNIDNSWQVTSYSGLINYNQGQESILSDALPKFDIETLSDNFEDHNMPTNSDEMIYDIHHFPKGAHVGTLLHECFEHCDFIQPNVSNIAEYLVTKLNLEDGWLSPLADWFLNVLQAPITSSFSLSHLSSVYRLNELSFYLPIKKRISTLQIDEICKTYDPISKKCHSLNSLALQGMLKGFIDMIFEREGQYYIVDYKSNYLGDSIDHYDQQSLENAMCEHRYDLQYQLYTLALHRYLKSRIADYQYEIHFGGIYYLFIRGMSKHSSDHGIFYTKPSFDFIQALDQLFN